MKKIRIVITEDKKAIGLYRDEKLLYSFSVNKPIVEDDTFTEACKYKYLNGNKYIAIADSAIYVSEYEIGKIEKISRKSKYEDIHVYSVDGELLSVSPNSKVFSVLAGTTITKATKTISDYSDNCLVFNYNGVKAILCVTITYEDAKEYIDKNTYIGEKRYLFRYTYDIVTPSGERVTGICGSTKEIADKTGYSLHWVNGVIARGVRNSKVKINKTTNS